MINAPAHSRQRPKLRDNASALQLANVANYALPAWVHEADEGSGCSGRTVPEADLALLTMKEAAAYLRVSTRTVQRQIKDGYLKAVRIGRNVRIERSALAQGLAPQSSFSSNTLGLYRD